MALTISRRVYFTWAASSDIAGINGSKISHSASVTSEEYAFRSLISSSPLPVLFTYASPFLYRLNHPKLTLSKSSESNQAIQSWDCSNRLRHARSESEPTPLSTAHIPSSRKEYWQQAYTSSARSRSLTLLTPRFLLHALCWRACSS